MFYGVQWDRYKYIIHKKKYYHCDELNEDENNILNVVLFNLDQPTAQIEIIKFFQNKKQSNKKIKNIIYFQQLYLKKLKQK